VSGIAVLVGAGHAHLPVIAAAGAFRRRGHKLVLVAPGPFWYSGLATGMLGGMYPPELDSIDVEALANERGGRFIRDRMVGLDRGRQLLILERSPPLHYDALSLDLGSAPPDIPGSDQARAWSVKPIDSLADLKAELERLFARDGEATRIVIAGAGATGCELAANIEALSRSRAARGVVTVLAGGDAVLRQLPRKAAERVERALVRRGIVFRRHARVIRLEEGRALLAGGDAIGFDVFVNATGLTPPALVSELGLPIGEGGGLIVDQHLRSPADPLVHGGGDCVALEGHALPRIGVYAIRQAPVLLHNLLAALEGGEPRSFEPQRRYLWILNLGDGTGLAVRGGLWWHGRAAFRLKDWIDRRFLTRYRPDGPTRRRT
jgi:NADH dehydrogenase FAD-containing subunit